MAGGGHAAPASRRVAGEPHFGADRAQRLVDHPQRPLHRHRLQPADAVVERLVERLQQEQQVAITATTEPISIALHDRALAAVGEEEHEAEDHGGDEEQRDPERRRDHADGAVDAIQPRLLARRGLLEPLVVGRLLGRRLRLHGLQRSKQPHAPGVDRVAQRAADHPAPLVVDDGAPVTDELPGQPTRAGCGKNWAFSTCCVRISASCSAPLRDWS